MPPNTSDNRQQYLDGVLLRVMPLFRDLLRQNVDEPEQHDPTDFGNQDQDENGEPVGTWSMSVSDDGPSLCRSRWAARLPAQRPVRETARTPASRRHRPPAAGYFVCVPEIRPDGDPFPEQFVIRCPIHDVDIQGSLGITVNEGAGVDARSPAVIAAAIAVIAAIPGICHLNLVLFLHVVVDQQVGILVPLKPTGLQFARDRALTRYWAPND